MLFLLKLYLTNSVGLDFPRFIHSRITNLVARFGGGPCGLDPPKLGGDLMPNLVCIADVSTLSDGYCSTWSEVDLATGQLIGSPINAAYQLTSDFGSLLDTYLMTVAGIVVLAPVLFFFRELVSLFYSTAKGR